jgi:hypothetical protein
MDIIILDKNVASSLREKFRQTDDVAGLIAKDHKGYEWSITLNNMILSELRLIGLPNERCVFIKSQVKPFIRLYGGITQ